MFLSDDEIALTLPVLLVLGAILFFRFRRQWDVARAEDEAFGMMRDEISSCVEIIGLDTRLLRPWGDSAAAERFVMEARMLGHGWLEAAVAPLHVEVPIAIRAIAGDIAGTRVAFLVARTRRMGTIAKALALGPAGLVEEIEELEADAIRPRLPLRTQLARIARRAEENATKT